MEVAVSNDETDETGSRVEVAVSNAESEEADSRVEGSGSNTNTQGSGSGGNTNNGLPTPPKPKLGENLLQINVYLDNLSEQIIATTATYAPVR